MLAIDCLVGGLLLSSIGVNILALGSFWVTPSLRTTANRFVINLLIVNLVCCIILGPSLLLNAFTSQTQAPLVTPLPEPEMSHVPPTHIYLLSEPSSPSEYAPGATDGTPTTLVFRESTDGMAVVATARTAATNRTRIVVKCGVKNGTMGGSDGPGPASNCDKLTEVEGEQDGEGPTEGLKEEEASDGPSIRPSPVGHGEEDELHAKLTLTKIRCWGLDLVVALGALSVLLVVGDTWCAITDPLRYHSRISELKAWTFIIATWVLGIAFGIASGFRGDQKTVTLFKNRLTAEEVAAIESSQWARNASGAGGGGGSGGSWSDPAASDGFIHQLNISEDLYNTIFSYTYFVIVILIPFALVCGMYWRIFSEARESGQRMRQNGSSPLLQSALNLVSSQKQAEKQQMLEQQQQQPHQQPPHPLPSIAERPCSEKLADGEGLTMKIDKQIHYEDETITISSIPHHHHHHHHHHRDSCLKPLLQQSPAPSPTHKAIGQHHEPDRPDRSQVVQIATPTSAVLPPSVLKSPLKHDRNHNSILMSLPPLESSTSGPIPTHPPVAMAMAGLGKVRRNHSAGRLVSFSEDRPELPPVGLRQVHSTPNFRKYSGGEFEQQLGNHHILSLPAVHVPPKALSYMTSIRHRLSNASSLFKYREESRAARISILVIIMFLVSYLPYGILVLMQGHVDLIIVSDQALLAIFTVVIANLSSPFIFAYRNKRVRRGVKRLLGIDRKTNERLQKLTTSNTHFNNHPQQQQLQLQQQFSGDSSVGHGNYGANLALATAADGQLGPVGGDAVGSNTVIDSCLHEVVVPGSEQQLVAGSAQKPHKVRIAGSSGSRSSSPGARGLTRSGSSCKYLTPNHAAAVAVANGYIVEFERYPSDELNSLCIQKKSILKRVCDSSRKWGCNFATNSCTSNDEQTEV
uniref:G-protein coupled receptors family 1 profile domain-containing protein n=1 Tax=Anopheles braziliensis TaxID=58242 RepID=A0A2M3Z1A8_9DIPT